MSRTNLNHLLARLQTSTLWSHKYNWFRIQLLDSCCRFDSIFTLHQQSSSSQAYQSNTEFCLRLQLQRTAISIIT